MKRTLFSSLLAATVLLGNAAHANFNTFSYGDRLDRRTTLNLGIIRAASDGIVEIYSYHRAEQGRLLGSTRVRGGANYDVRVFLKRRPITDVLAVLKVDGEVVAAKEYDIDRRQNSGLSRK